MKVLISAPYMLRATERPKVESLLKELPVEVTWADVHERLEEEDLLPIIGQFDGLICGDDRLTDRVYEAATRMKVVVKWGTGIDSLNASSAESRGIKLFRTPEAFTQPVADTTLCYILAFSRGLRENDSLMKRGEWDKPPSSALFETTVGIVGFGAIGRAVARRLRPFGCRILANDAKGVSPSAQLEYGVEEADLYSICRESKFITFHTDLNSTSHHLFGDEAVAQCRQKPYVINTSRGPVVDERALVDGLRKGVIAGAGLDVFEQEPLALDSPLRGMSNVYLASHNSNSSSACWLRVHRNSVQMLAKGLGL